MAEGTTVTASDTISTILGCPDQPPPEPPLPPGPGPIVPPGPRPPEAGIAGEAGAFVPPSVRRCLVSRVQRVTVRGTRISRISIFVNGQLRRRISFGVLQRRAAPRLRLAPGRNRIDVRAVFQRGAATAPVTVSRIVHICVPPPTGPRFTG
jgi:hypothetical protein